MGIGVGYMSHIFFNSNSVRPDKFKEIRQGGYRYINPLLECTDEGFTNFETSILKKKVETYINNKKQQNGFEVAMYFRDLNNGPWFGINESSDFTPGSMLKVPTMILFYKLADEDPDILNTVIKVKELSNITQDIKPKEVIEPNKSYTINELIRRMIVYSDNEAGFALLNYMQKLNPDKISEIYTDLGIEVPGVRNKDDFLDVVAYSRFFRVLYNASYLNKEYSEAALELLSKVDFKEGIVAGVPNKFTIAHKFGEREQSTNQIKQLHDCGIVYYPNSPYLICIMTRGEAENLEIHKKIIQDISNLVYQDFDTNKRKK
jgi:beta-lactamase class A